jgi:hypothetical protein
MASAEEFLNSAHRRKADCLILETRDGGSQVLITAGRFRQRAATADAPRGDYLRLAPGVPTLTLPRLMPTFVSGRSTVR